MKFLENIELDYAPPRIGREEMRLYTRKINEIGVEKNRLLFAMEHVTEKE